MIMTLLQVKTFESLAEKPFTGKKNYQFKQPDFYIKPFTYFLLLSHFSVFSKTTKIIKLFKKNEIILSNIYLLDKKSY